MSYIGTTHTLWNYTYYAVSGQKVESLTVVPVLIVGNLTVKPKTGPGTGTLKIHDIHV